MNPKKILLGLIGATLLFGFITWFENHFNKKTSAANSVESALHDLDSRDPRIRLSAAQVLYRLKSEKAVKPLIIAFTDRDKAVREMAALAVGEMKDQKTLELLLSALQDPYPPVRAMAALALGKIKNPGTVDPLIAMLSDESEEVRSRVFGALMEFEDHRWEFSFIDKVKDQSLSIRMSAINALGKWKDPRLAPLTAALKDPDPKIRLQALSALQEIKSQIEEAADFQEIGINSLTLKERAEVGEWVIFGPDGREKRGIGKGRCPLCHTFEQGGLDARAPNLFGAVKRAGERVRERRYQERTVESFPGSGRATTAMEYIAESKICPSCYIVVGYGVRGTNDEVSLDSAFHKPPMNLTINEMIAVDTWLYLTEGETPPSIKEMRASYEKFIPPSERRY